MGHDGIAVAVAHDLLLSLLARGDVAVFVLFLCSEVVLAIGVSNPKRVCESFVPNLNIFINCVLLFSRNDSFD